MARILRGKNILERVRRKIKDETYSSFDEINEAQNYIEKYAPFNFLRKSNILGAGLQADTREYDLNLGDVRSIERIWIGTAETTTVGDIEGITLSGSLPVSIQITAHGLTTGRQIIPDSVGGTTELNDNIYKVTVTDANNFTLQGTDSSNFTAWTSGGEVSVYDVDDETWVLMEEAPAQIFEETVQYNTQTNANVNTSTVVVSTTETQSNKTGSQWRYYLKSGDANPFMKMVVTPTPSTTYRIKVDYLKAPIEITEDVVPDVPVPYYDSLILIASAYILERSENQADLGLSARYFARGQSELFRLLNDTHRNRTGSVDRPLAPWKI